MSGAAQGRRRRAAWAIVALGIMGSGTPASASSWNRAAGEGLAIVDYTFASGDETYDGHGRLAPGRAYSKGEAAAYVEYGATDWLTLIARPSLDSVRVGAPDASTYRGLGDTAVGAQWQALVFGPAVLAVQGSFMLPGARSSTDAAAVGNTAKAAEARLLGGVALPVPFRPFVDLQTSYRVRSSCDRQEPVAVAGIIRDLPGLADLARERALCCGIRAVRRFADRQEPMAKAEAGAPQGNGLEGGRKADRSVKWPPCVAGLEKVGEV